MGEKESLALRFSHRDHEGTQQRHLQTSPRLDDIALLSNNASQAQKLLTHVVMTCNTPTVSLLQTQSGQLLVNVTDFKYLG